jgi:hypothetical protein
MSPSPSAQRRAFVLDLHPVTRAGRSASLWWSRTMAVHVQICSGRQAVAGGRGKSTFGTMRQRKCRVERRGTVRTGCVSSARDVMLARRPATGRPPGPHARRGCGGRGGAERRRLDLRKAQLGNHALISLVRRQTASQAACG